MPVNEEGSSEVYAFGGYSHRDGSGNGFRRCAADCASFTGRNWPEIFPLGYLPTISGTATDYSTTGGLRGEVGGWNYDLGAEFGHNDFEYNITNTLNASLGPCLDPPIRARRGRTGILGTADDPGSRTRPRSSRGRCCARNLWPRSTSRAR